MGKRIEFQIVNWGHVPAATISGAALRKRALKYLRIARHVDDVPHHCTFCRVERTGKRWAKALDRSSGYHVMICPSCAKRIAKAAGIK